MCWNNSRGIQPNTKAINSSNTVSLINNSDEGQDFLEANSYYLLIILKYL